MVTYVPKHWLHYGMKAGVIFRRGYAQPFGCAAGCGLDRCAGRRWVRAETGGRPGNDSLPGLEEESRVIRLFWIRWSRWGPPVLPGAALVLRCRRRLTSRGVVLMMGVLGPGGLAALFLMPTRPVPRILLSVTVIKVARVMVRVAFLHAVITYISRVCMSWLAEGSPRARLAVLSPGSIIAASSSGGMMVSAVAPVIARSVTRVPGPAVEPRRS